MGAVFGCRGFHPSELNSRNRDFAGHENWGSYLCYTGKCLAQVAVINEVSESIASEFLAWLGTASLFPALLISARIGTKNTLLERLGKGSGILLDDLLAGL